MSETQRHIDGGRVSNERPDSEGRSADAVIAAGALKNPVRWFLHGLLTDRPMSASELAELAEMRPSAVRRHLRAMRAAGVIEIAGLRTRRNTAEQVYRSCKDLILTKAARADQTVEERRRFDAYTLKVAIGEALRSLVSSDAARSIDRVDECVTRIPMRVDEDGWAELARAHEEFFFHVLELRDRIEKRVRDEEKATSIRATSFILFFEASPPR